jgi:hypothetical protein
MDKASIWLAIRNPVFRKYWLAALISGICEGHNTAAFSVLGKTAESALYPLMSTLALLALFTLPAGTLQTWPIAAILWITNLWQARWCLV